MAQSVGDYDIEVVRGASLVVEVVYEQESDVTPGLYDPIPLGTGWTGRMQVRARSGATVIAEFSTANSRMTLNDEGLVQVKIGKTVSEALNLGKYRYDIRIDGPDDAAVYLLEGKFTVADRITVPTP
jgi:hypothetical protein